MNNQYELDMMEFFSFLKEKHRSIIISMVFALFLSVGFILINNDKISINYEIKINIDSPGMVVNCENDFYCKSNFIKGVISKMGISDRYKITSNNKSIILTWEGDSVQNDVISAELATINKNISDWYAQDYQVYKKIIDDHQINQMDESQLYTKIVFMIRSYFSGVHEGMFTGTEIISKKYKSNLLVVSFFLITGFILSVSYLLCTQMFTYRKLGDASN